MNEAEEELGPAVFITEHDDGSADFTIAIDDEDHRFSASPDGENATLQYEETQSWRGIIRQKSPQEYVWRELMQSDEMTDYLDRNGLAGVRRDRLQS